MSIPEDRDRPISDPESIPGDGELFVYSQDDLDQIASEWFVWVRCHPEVDVDVAEDMTQALYSHLTGGWMDCDTDEDE